MLLVGSRAKKEFLRDLPWEMVVLPGHQAQASRAAPHCPRILRNK